jgi:hypothetical protein
MSKNKELPMELVVRVNSTNGTTMLKAFEDICAELRKFNFPESGLGVSHEFWRWDVISSTCSLDEPIS